MKKPLAKGTVALLASSLLALHADKSYLLTFTGFSLSLFLIFISLALLFKIRIFKTVALLSAFTLIGFSLYLFVHLPKAEFAKNFIGFDGEVTAKVTSIEKYGYYSNVTVSTDTIGSTDANVKISLSVYENTDNLSEGDVVRITGKICTLPSSSLTFNNENYSAARGIFLKMVPDSIEITETGTNIFAHTVYKFRKACVEKLSYLDNSGFISALLLGVKTNLLPETSADFQKLGLSHAIAISGMHLSILIMSLYMFLRRGAVGKYLLCIICSFLTVFYMALTGFTFSVTRAGIMMIIYFLSLFSRRQNDSVTTLSLSALLICCNNTWAVLDVGLQLSFMSTLGILVFVPKILKKFETLKKSAKKNFFIRLFKKLFFELIALIFNTVAATVASLPLMLIYFRSVAALSIVANILVLFLVNVLILVSLFYVICAFLLKDFIFPTCILKPICDIISSTVLYEVSLLSKVFPEPISFSPEAAKVLALISGVVLVIFLIINRPMCLTILTFTNILLVALFSLIFPLVFSHLPTVTHSTSATCRDIIVEQKGKTTLISPLSTSTRALFEMLDYRSIAKIDEAIFLTDGEADTERIEQIISECEISKIVLIPALSYSINQREFEELKLLLPTTTELEQITENTYSPNDTVTIVKENKSYIRIEIGTDTQSTVIVHSLNSILLPYSPELETADTIFVYGTEKLPYIEKANIYCEENEKGDTPNNTKSIDKYSFFFLKFSHDSITCEGVAK